MSHEVMTVSTDTGTISIKCEHSRPFIIRSQEIRAFLEKEAAYFMRKQDEEISKWVALSRTNRELRKKNAKLAKLQKALKATPRFVKLEHRKKQLVRNSKPLWNALGLFIRDSRGFRGKRQ